MFQQTTDQWGQMQEKMAEWVLFFFSLIYIGLVSFLSSVASLSFALNMWDMHFFVIPNNRQGWRENGWLPILGLRNAFTCCLPRLCE
jgi:hypothetical protein